MTQQTRFKITLLFGIFALILATLLLIFKQISAEIWKDFCIFFDLPVLFAFIGSKTADNIMRAKIKAQGGNNVG